ncbi:hypothetical protein [Corallococcus sicarius]|uniref:Uncharacterized protein n=1 Tax=Corallococcus sicarius TaxID=2316726 RepID=A0A3A8NC35_9BACT|nr:hypothetical protein [Corallococcus sicarius]RKH39731.1 hypothetical protein D7X12_22860 [Corallococcus sicarius]
MKPFRALAALVTLTLAPSALAEAEAPLNGVPYVFVTVDAYRVRSSGLMEVTGILQGETTPRVIGFYDTNAAERCDRLALLAQSRPGRYLLELTDTYDSVSCKLIRQ